MSKKTTYYIVSFIGSIIGGYVPLLWGAGFFSFSSLLFSALGGIMGIIIVYKYLW